MQALYLKTPFSATSLVVLFSLLGLVFQPVFIFAASGVALHFLLGNYRMGFALMGVSVLVLWLALLFLFQQEGNAIVQYEAYWVLLGFYLPLATSSLVLKQTNNQAYAVLLIACVTMIATSAFSVFGLPYLDTVKEFLLVASQKNTALNPADIDNVVAFLVPATGITIFLFLTLSLFLARFWQSKAFNPNGFGEEFRRFQLGKTLVLALVFLMVLGFTDVVFIKDWRLIVVFFLCLQGLALCHFFAKRKQTSKKIIGLFYVLLFLILPVFFAPLWAILIFLLVTATLVDCFLDFRHRYAGTSPR